MGIILFDFIPAWPIIPSVRWRSGSVTPFSAARIAPKDVIGELWASFFDGGTNYRVVVKKEVSFHQCTFKSDEFFVRVNDASLEQGRPREGPAFEISTDARDHGVEIRI